MNSSVANNTQVGGDHYKGDPVEHWDWVAARRLDYFQGNISKYVKRWRKKDGVKDLRKAAHYLDKYIELCASGAKLPFPWLLSYDAKFITDAVCAGWGLAYGETKVVALVAEWAGDVNLLHAARLELKAITLAALDAEPTGAGYVAQ